MVVGKPAWTISVGFLIGGQPLESTTQQLKVLSLSNTSCSAAQQRVDLAFLLVHPWFEECIRMSVGKKLGSQNYEKLLFAK